MLNPITEKQAPKMATSVNECAKLEQDLTETLLDSIAECFDKEAPLSPETLVEVDGYHITARALVQRIRLHGSLNRLGESD